MRNLYLLDAMRDRSEPVIRHYGSTGDDTCGVFDVPSPIDRKPMRVVASSDAGWDHVSVSRPNRCPNWAEMEHVKRLFFRDDETAMQLHVPASDHINLHPYCLHLWRPRTVAIPRPPGWMVGPSTINSGSGANRSETVEDSANCLAERDERTSFGVGLHHEIDERPNHATCAEKDFPRTEND